MWKKTPAAANQRPHRRRHRQSALRRIRTTRNTRAAKEEPGLLPPSFLSGIALRRRTAFSRPIDSFRIPEFRPARLVAAFRWLRPSTPFSSADFVVFFFPLFFFWPHLPLRNATVPRRIPPNSTDYSSDARRSLRLTVSLSLSFSFRVLAVRSFRVFFVIHRFLPAGPSIVFAETPPTPRRTEMKTRKKTILFVFFKYFSS